MKKKSLVKQFAALFIIFAFAAILLSGIVSYAKQNSSYHKECMNSLQQITQHLANEISKEGEEFSNLKTWFQEHGDQVQIPVDFRADLPVSKAAFQSYTAEHWPGKVFGQDFRFQDLDMEGKRLYAIYRFEYWFTEFFDAADEFGLSYVYFIYPEEDMDHAMTYMFDVGMATETTSDGREILVLEKGHYEDPAIHPFMWEAWDSSEAPNGFDSLNNEFGYQYTYCRPVWSGEEKVGLICVDLNVERVNQEILSHVIQQNLITITVLAISMAVLFLFLRSRIFQRILTLEKGVESYSREKDPALAAEIQANRGQNDELATLADKFSGMITELDHYMTNLQAVTKEKERIGAELDLATRIQANMLPNLFPAFPERSDFDIYASMTPAKEVGGDFYDFFLIDDDHLAMVIADVSGKGVPAALFMMMSMILINNTARMEGPNASPGAVLTKVNNTICANNAEEMFVTVWLAILDLNTGRVVAANAGHEYPMIQRAGGSFELFKDRHGLVVGAMEGIRFREYDFQLKKGDALFVYTDGVAEATDAHEELFGTERALDALNKAPDESPKTLLHNVKASVDEFVGEAPQFDDLTMLSLRYFGKQ